MVLTWYLHSTRPYYLRANFFYAAVFVTLRGNDALGKITQLAQGVRFLQFFLFFNFCLRFYLTGSFLCSDLSGLAQPFITTQPTHDPIGNPVGAAA